ncbi:MAG: hypothetical protein E7086_05220 [Bacteroidales bacterium]|nr:hypothetical protein [Bacteroidales bacterium]
MKKFNDKTTVDRLFNGLLGEQGMWYLCKVLLCLFLFLSGTAVCAQSNEGNVEIPLEKIGDDLISNDEDYKRDLELEAILPTAMYDVSNESLNIISPHVTFESVTYYIMDANGIIVATDEIDLPKNVEVILPLLQLSRGSYRIILGIDGVYYVGEFDVE